VTIFSATLPEIDAICRSIVGRDVVAADRIGAGRNSRVFRVSLAGGAPAVPSELVVKFYRRDPGDPRDRLATEFGGLQFLWQNGVRAIPCPIAADRDRHCALYEYLTGEIPDERTIAPGDIDAAVRFLAELKSLRNQPESAALPIASEAQFSLRGIAALVVERFERLRRGGGDGGRRSLQDWLDGTFEPLLREVIDWCRLAAARAAISFDDELPLESRTLSPSDFGFHNAIRRPDGSLAFVDFEYFGWDDPAKTVVDFVLHPGMTLSDSLKRRFVDSMLAAFDGVAGLGDRVRLVYPLFGLKWCLILLNEFLPERIAAASADADDARWASDRRAAQLDAADRLATRVRREYPRGPVLAIHD
jgi:hypothetical protein